MKIIILSDLNWNKNEIIDIENYYLKTIIENKPDLILFAGDVTGDGSCGHGHHEKFYKLLTITETLKIQSYFIQGNHDERKYYSILLNNIKNLKYTKEISGKSVIYSGLKILGLSFQNTNKKSELKSLITSEQYDIILAHAELKRRTWLFDFNSDIIITGHYDMKICQIEKKIFLSFANDFPFKNYGTIDFQKESYKINFYYRDSISRNDEKEQTLSKMKNVEADFINGKLTIKKTKLSRNELFEYYIFGADYKKGIELIRKSKNKKYFTNDFIEKLTSLEYARFKTISENLLYDYIGGKKTLPNAS